MGQVNLERRDGMAILTIDNPPLNVLSVELGEQLIEVLKELENDTSVFAVIVTGAGQKAFMAGADIREFPGYVANNSAEQMSLAFHEAMNRLHDLPKPTIAALNGLTLGGGCELALACDFRFAEEQILIGLPEIKLGLFPGAGGTQRLARLIGEARAKEMILTGEPVSATEAYRLGLVNRIVEPGTVLTGALDWAKVFSERSQVALAKAKQAVQEGLDLELKDGLRLEARLFGEVFQSHDVQEGVSAFLEKRKPNFLHR